MKMSSYISTCSGKNLQRTKIRRRRDTSYPDTFYIGMEWNEGSRVFICWQNWNTGRWLWYVPVLAIGPSNLGKLCYTYYKGFSITDRYGYFVVRLLFSDKTALFTSKL